MYLNFVEKNLIKNKKYIIDLPQILVPHVKLEFCHFYFSIQVCL